VGASGEGMVYMTEQLGNGKTGELIELISPSTENNAFSKLVSTLRLGTGVQELSLLTRDDLEALYGRMDGFVVPSVKPDQNVLTILLEQLLRISKTELQRLDFSQVDSLSWSNL